MYTNEINIRDPYVLVHDGSYYLYGTRSNTCWGNAEGFDCYKSSDMEHWDGPMEIFRRPVDFFATESFWAPECYYYNGRFYLLTTFGGPKMKKGIYLLVSDHPDGGFVPYGGRLTPENWTCIDATLYFENNHVYMIYSHSFEDTPNADICLEELESDLSSAKTCPRVLFSAKEAPWSKPVPFAEQEFGMKGDVYFSDGPCVFRMENGKLYLTWSSWSNRSYAVGAAVSENGTVEGPWTQIETPIWPENGGHGMVFQSLEGERYFVLHYPNDRAKERPCFKRLVLEGDRLMLSDIKEAEHEAV